MAEYKDKISRPKSNVAQIAAAIIGLLTFLFGSNLIGNQCSKKEINKQQAQQNSKIDKAKSEEIRVESNTPEYDFGVLYDYQVRAPEIESGIWNKLETLISDKNYTKAVATIDSLIKVESNHKATRIVLIDCKNGVQLMSEKDFDNVNWNGGMNIVTVSMKGKVGIYNTNVEEIFSPQFEDVLVANQNLFLVLKNEKWGFVNRYKDFKIYPKYDNVFDVYLPFTVVKIEDKFGIVNYQGKEICQPDYDNVSLLKNGIIVLQSNGKFEMIDTNGIKILKDKFDFIETDSSQDLIQILKGDKEFLFNSLTRKLEKRN